MRPALLLFPLLAAATRDTVPAATPVGSPRTCVNRTLLRESFVRSDRVIDFRTTGGLYYRVTLAQPCPGLAYERRFAYSTSIPQLCAQDIITVFSNAPIMRGASCGLAPFQLVKLNQRP